MPETEQLAATERLAAVAEIHRIKAAYWRGVDTSDGDLVRSILAVDCALDFRGCCTDPTSGHDFMPTMNVVLKGRDSWVSDAFKQAGIVSVHQGHQAEIEVTGAITASGVWSFTDRLFFPKGAQYSQFRGFGFYHDTYEQSDCGWLLKTTRVTRLKVGAW